MLPRRVRAASTDLHWDNQDRRISHSLTWLIHLRRRAQCRSVVARTRRASLSLIYKSAKVSARPKSRISLFLFCAAVDEPSSALSGEGEAAKEEASGDEACEGKDTEEVGELEFEEALYQQRLASILHMREHIDKEVEKNRKAAQVKQKADYDRHHHTPGKAWKVGDQVMIIDMRQKSRQGGKMDMFRSDGYTITEIDEFHNCCVKNNKTGLILKNKFPSVQLAPLNVAGVPGKDFFNGCVEQDPTFLRPTKDDVSPVPIGMAGSLQVQPCGTHLPICYLHKSRLPSRLRVSAK